MISVSTYAKVLIWKQFTTVVICAYDGDEVFLPMQKY